MGIVAVQISSAEPPEVKKMTFGGALTAVVGMDSPDVLVVADDGKLLAIERKTAQDFVASIQDGRLTRQIAVMREMTPWIYVLLDGHLQPDLVGDTLIDGQRSGWKWNAVVGAMITAQELGAVIVPCPGEFESRVVALAERSRGDVRLKPHRSATAVLPAEHILHALPQVGDATAAMMLGVFGMRVDLMLAYLTNNDQDDHPDAKIGKSKRDKIRSAMGLMGGTMLAPAEVESVGRIWSQYLVDWIEERRVSSGSAEVTV